MRFTRYILLKQNRRLKKKLTVVFVVILVYIFGQNIPLPYVQINTAESYSNQTFLQMLQTINGSDRQAFSIFSLGIIPYMMASILLMLKSLGESDKKQISVLSQARQTKLLTLVICFVMALIRTADYEYTNLLLGSILLSRVFTMILLIAGVFAIIWLADFNTGQGIGGMVVIIIVNIIKNMLRSVVKVWIGFQTGVYAGGEDVCRIVVLAAIGLISMFIILLFEESELRIPVQRVMIYNEMSKDNYMAFKLDPIGIQPLMYVMAFYIIPFFLLSILAGVFPDITIFARLALCVQLNNFIGIGIYLFLFLLLTLALVFVQISPSDISEQMQKSGDCIIGLRPGRETQDFLTTIVLRLTLVSSVVLGGLVALPLILKVVWGLPQDLAMLPMSLMFIGGISRNIYQEIAVVKRLDSYQEVL